MESTIYINNQLLRFQNTLTFPVNPGTVQIDTSKVVAGNEVLVVQTIRGTYHIEDSDITVLGYAQTRNILGRIVAVTGPPAHRKLIQSGHFNEGPPVAVAY